MLLSIIVAKCVCDPSSEITLNYMEAFKQTNSYFSFYYFYYYQRLIILPLLFVFFRFLLTRYAESLGQFAAASQSCNFSLRFFHSNQKDVSPSRPRDPISFPSAPSIHGLFSLSLPVRFPSLQTSEYIIQAYKYGAFEKIPEFIALRNRLNHSLHFAQVRTERMLLDLFLEADMWEGGKKKQTNQKRKKTKHWTPVLKSSGLKSVFFPLFVFQCFESGGECEGNVFVRRGGWHPLGQYEGQQRSDCFHQLGPEREVWDSLIFIFSYRSVIGHFWHR